MKKHVIALVLIAASVITILYIGVFVGTPNVDASSEVPDLSDSQVNSDLQAFAISVFLRGKLGQIQVYKKLRDGKSDVAMKLLKVDIALTGDELELLASLLGTDVESLIKEHEVIADLVSEAEEIVDANSVSELKQSDAEPLPPEVGRPNRRRVVLEDQID